jgi:hypothetical protein
MNDLRRIGDSGAQNKDVLSSNNSNRTEKIEYEMIDEEGSDFTEHETDSLRNFQKQSSSPSISSGEYEEIPDGEFDEEYKSLVDTPPPLPPRKSNNSSPSR